MAENNRRMMINEHEIYIVVPFTLTMEIPEHLELHFVNAVSIYFVEVDEFQQLSLLTYF